MYEVLCREEVPVFLKAGFSHLGKETAEATIKAAKKYGVVAYQVAWEYLNGGDMRKAIARRLMQNAFEKSKSKSRVNNKLRVNVIKTPDGTVEATFYGQTGALDRSRLLNRLVNKEEIKPKIVEVKVKESVVRVVKNVDANDSAKKTLMPVFLEDGFLHLGKETAETTIKLLKNMVWLRGNI